MNDSLPPLRGLDIGDTVIPYLEYPGGGPDLILLHATGFMPWLWHPIAIGLARSHRVIVPYFCDHRPASVKEGGLSWDILAGDLARMCERLKLKNPCMAGHSMGGAIAVLASAAHGLAPRAMVLIEPILLPEPVYSAAVTVEEHPLASKSIKRRNAWQDKREARDYLVSKKLFASWNPEVLELYLTHGLIPSPAGGLSLACNPSREAALFLGSNAKNPWPLLKTIPCPALVLEGETSENPRFIDFKKAASLLPKGEHRIIPGAGHLIPMERPGLILDILREFFHTP